MRTDKKPTYILGISCYYHDSAAVLLKDGEVVFASQEERYTRKKHDESFPVRSIQAALSFAGIDILGIDAIGFYEKPFYKFFDRILPRFFQTWPRGRQSFCHAMYSWLTSKLWTHRDIRKKLGYKGEIFYVPHHLSHAASSYYHSGFSDAAILVIDGVGEWATTSIGSASGVDIRLTQEIRYPHSLGLLYSAITYFLGFKVNSAEYKVMGLAPYGEPRYLDEMRKLITIYEDGSFSLDMSYFTFEHTLRMTGKKMEKLFGFSRRMPEEQLLQCHKDLARSLQEVLEEAVLGLAQYAKSQTKSTNLCLAGGVALNCVANGRLKKEKVFENIYIQPASGDAGGALGVASYLWHTHLGNMQTRRLEHVFLGDSFSHDAIREALVHEKVSFQELSDNDLFDVVASYIEDGGVVGWFQGAMEFGPRALGNRSILADPRDEKNWSRVNLKIKFREDFRPFAPVVLEEKAQEYFDIQGPSRYMLFVANVLEKKRSGLPAITHVDGSARVQTVTRDIHPRFYDLISAFDQKTGCPVLINTSFNIRGEPIVRTPQEALHCFLHTDMDYLVLGNCVLDKKRIGHIPKSETYREQFTLD